MGFEMTFIHFRKKPGYHESKCTCRGTYDEIVLGDDADWKSQVRVASSFEKTGINLNVAHDCSQY